MSSALRHRGPDGQGHYEFPNCLLCHTRLSIIDLAGGGQPMVDISGRRGLVFNGEIYGYREIRRKLAPYPFRTVSDTEVILALYERHGTSMLPRLPGMFAFALWDEREQRLFCGRDRFGEKPLYYGWGEGGEFVFASEIKAIVASGLVKPRLDRASLAHYLRRLYVHPHRTIYSNIHVLPPAHYMVLDQRGLRPERYWRLPDGCGATGLEEAVGRFGELVHQSVRRQLVADVPVGAFLSGGLDSTTLVAAAAKVHPGLRTFSFGMQGERSELHYARAAAERYGTAHMELAEGDFDLAGLLVELQGVYDEPFADSSSIPTYLICRAARKYAKVAIAGDGADELLGGYDYWYVPLKEMELAAPWPTVPGFLARTLLRVANRIGAPRSVSRRLRGMAMLREHGSIVKAHSAQNCIFSDADLARLGLVCPADGQLNRTSWEIEDTVNDAMRMDLENYLPGDILVKTDRASMAHGLELRAPFLDVDLASFCIGLPSNLKISTRADKMILRAAFSAEWPDVIRARGKQGFGGAVREWLQKDSFRELVRSTLDDPRSALFDLVPFAESRRFAAEGGYQTWTLLVLGVWAATRLCPARPNAVVRDEVLRTNTAGLPS